MGYPGQHVRPLVHSSDPYNLWGCIDLPFIFMEQEKNYLTQIKSGSSFTCSLASFSTWLQKKNSLFKDASISMV